MKKTVKVMAFVLCAVMLVVGSVFGTYAYLTSQTDTITNTFTVGNVTITLDESKVDVYGVVQGTDRVKANTYKLIPGHTYTKDPKVTVTAGSEQAYVFVSVVNQIAGVEDATTIANQMAANGWTALTGVANVYYYKNGDNAIVDARNAVVELPVFSTLKIKTDADVSGLADKTVTVKAYAIQADGFADVNAAWDASGFAALV